KRTGLRLLVMIPILPAANRESWMCIAPLPKWDLMAVLIATGSFHPTPLEQCARKFQPVLLRYDYPESSKLSMSNPLTKLIEPWYPATAVGLERGLAAMVQLEGGRRNRFALRRAASLALPDGLIVPGFDQSNISDLTELAESLRDLATSAGLARQRKWSVTLPEASSRTLIVTIESHVTSKSELDEVLKWKLERGFGAALDELSLSRDRLPNDSQGRERYIAVAVKA